MEESVVITCLSVALVAHIISVTVRERRYQHTIDRLTDKLMARDYSEYKRHERTLTPHDDRQRKPMSYYDDSSIEVEDVQ